MSANDSKGSRHAPPGLHKADELTQARTDKILLLMAVARVVLASGTPMQRRDGLRLLKLVSDEVADLQNESNSLAENNGASNFRSFNPEGGAA